MASYFSLPILTQAPLPGSSIKDLMAAELVVNTRKDNPDSWYPILITISVVVVVVGKPWRHATLFWHSGLGG